MVIRVEYSPEPKLLISNFIFIIYVTLEFVHGGETVKFRFLKKYCSTCIHTQYHVLLIYIYNTVHVYVYVYVHAWYPVDMFHVLMQVQFRPGQTSVQLSILVKADSTAESDEPISVELTSVVVSGTDLPGRGATLGMCCMPMSYSYGSYPIMLLICLHLCLLQH